MTPATIIYTLLKDSSTVGALIDNRIYPSVIPADTPYPSVTYSELTQQFDDTKDGPIPTGVHDFDVDIYAKNYASIQAISTAIKSVLSWYTGTVNTVNVERIMFIDQSDLPYEEEKELFHAVQQYSIRIAA